MSTVKDLPVISGKVKDWDVWLRVELPLWGALNKIPELMELLAMTKNQRDVGVVMNPKTEKDEPQDGWNSSKVKHAIKLAVADQLLGASIVKATEDTHCGVTHITRRADFKMSGAAMVEALSANFDTSRDSAMDDKSEELDRVRPDMSLADVESMRKWKSDVITIHQEIVELAGNDGDRMACVTTEQHQVKKLRKMAPDRHITAGHWETTQNAKTLEQFFVPMVKYDEARKDKERHNDGDQGSASLAAAIRMTKNSLPAKFQAAFALVMASSGSNVEELPEEGGGKRKRSGFANGSCWECGDTNHRRQDCNVYKRNVANGTVEARKKKKMKPVTATSAEEVVRTKTCKWFAANGTCSYGKKCKFLHEEKTAAEKSANAIEMDEASSDEEDSSNGRVLTATGPSKRSNATIVEAPNGKKFKWSKQSQAFVLYPALVVACLFMLSASVQAAQPIRQHKFCNLVNLAVSDMTPACKQTSEEWRPVDTFGRVKPAGACAVQGCRCKGLKAATNVVWAAVSNATTQQRSREQQIRKATAGLSQYAKLLWDSGANISAVHDKNLLTNYVGCNSISNVGDAGGIKHKVLGYGDMLLQVNSDQGIKTVVVKDVLYIPTFKLHILSEFEMRRGGYEYKASWLPSVPTLKTRSGNCTALHTEKGHNYLCGKVTHDYVHDMMIEDVDGSAVHAATRAENRTTVDVRTASTFASFKEKVHKIEDTELLLGLLSTNVDKHAKGEVNMGNNFDGKRQGVIMNRLADLQVFTCEDPTVSAYLSFHHRFGHRSMQQTTEMALEHGIKLPPLEKRFCEACVEAKMRKRSKGKTLHRNKEKKYEPLDLWFADVAGPFNESAHHGGYNYVLGFICATTHTIRIYPLHNLKEVQQETKCFLNWLLRTRKERSTRNRDIQLDIVRDGLFDVMSGGVIQTDSASYFRSKSFTKLVNDEYGTTLRHSPPVDQSRNGMIERAWLTLHTSAQAMRAAQRLGPKYWWWSWQHAAEIHDITRTSANVDRMSPYEARTGNSPSIAHIGSFGARCFVVDPNHKKLEMKAVAGVYVGHNKDNISHRIWFEGTVSKRASYRESRHVWISDKLLPLPVQKGEVGMTAPGYNTFHPDDDDAEDAHVPVVRLDRRIRQEVTGNAEEATSLGNGDEDGGVTEDVVTPSNVLGSGGVPDDVTPTNLLDANDYGDNSISSDALDSDASNSNGTNSTIENVGNISVRDNDEEVLPCDEGMLDLNAHWPGRFGNESDDEDSQSYYVSACMDADNRRSKESGTKEMHVNACNSGYRPNSCLIDWGVEYLASTTVGMVASAMGAIQFDIRKRKHELKDDPEEMAKLEASLKKEMDGLDKFEVMEDVLYTDLPADTKLFNSFMLTHRKALGDGKWKWKSRLVVDGRGAVPGVHTDTLNYNSHLPPWGTVRLLISFAAGCGWELRIGDVAQAFIKGYPGKEIFMLSPIGLREYRDVDGQQVMVVKKIIKNLYGRKDGPRLWEMAFADWAGDTDFNRCESDLCLWARDIGTDKATFMCVFCDDIFITAPNAACFDRISKELAEKWDDCHVELPKFALGCDIEQNENGIKICAKTKIDALLKDINMDVCKIKKTALEPGVDINVDDCPKNGEPPLKEEYRQVLGRISYMMTSCRPDLAHAVSQLSRVQANPGRIHWRQLMHVCRYLRGTRTHGVSFRRMDGTNEEKHVVTSYADAAWADIRGGIGDKNAATQARHSSLGYILFMNGGPITWKSKVSCSIALSSAEAELFASVHCAKEIAHIRRLCKLLGIEQLEPTTMYDDSTAAIAINNSDATTARLRHIEIKWFFVRQLREQGLVRMKKIHTDENVSDHLTKALAAPKFCKFRDMMVSAEIAGATKMPKVMAMGWGQFNPW